MTRKEYDKIIRLMHNGAISGIIYDEDKIDGECEEVIPLKDAIEIVYLVYEEEKNEKSNN